MYRAFVSTLLLAISFIALPCFAQCDPCCEEVCEPSRSKNFCCNFNFCCPALYVKADYIYWTARQDGLEYAFSGGNQLLNGDIEHKGKVYGLNWDWDSGFKAGAGFILECSGWDTSLTYTRLCTNPHNSCAVTNEDFDLFKCWETLVFEESTLNEAKAEWRLQFNVVDFDIANEFFINDCFSMRPHFGIKGAWHDQHFKVHYFAEDFTDYDMKHDYDYWGIGPRVGLDVAAHLGWCTSLFGDVSFSSLWSEYCDCREDSALFPIIFSNCDCDNNQMGGGPFRVLHVENRNHDTFPVLELCVGARWEMPLCGGCYLIRGKICWEHQIWWNQNRLVHICANGHPSHGDLTLQGLTVGLSVDF